MEGCRNGLSIWCLWILRSDRSIDCYLYRRIFLIIFFGLRSGEGGIGEY